VGDCYLARRALLQCLVRQLPTSAQLPPTGLHNYKHKPATRTLSARLLHKRPRTPPFPNPCMLSLHVDMSWCPSAAEGMCNPEPERVPAAVRLIQPVTPPQSAVVPPSVATAHPAAVTLPGAPHYTVLTQSAVASPLAAAAPQPVVSPPAAAMLPGAPQRTVVRNHASRSRAAQSPSSPRRLAACCRSPACCLSARRLAICRRSEHSHLAACRRIGDHPTPATETCLFPLRPKFPPPLPSL
jgi:hypothetical protein